MKRRGIATIEEAAAEELIESDVRIGAPVATIDAGTPVTVDEHESQIAAIQQQIKAVSDERSALHDRREKVNGEIAKRRSEVDSLTDLVAHGDTGARSRSRELLDQTVDLDIEARSIGIALEKLDERDRELDSRLGAVHLTQSRDRALHEVAYLEERGIAAMNEVFAAVAKLSEASATFDAVRAAFRQHDLRAAVAERGSWDRLKEAHRPRVSEFLARSRSIQVPAWVILYDSI